MDIFSMESLARKFDGTMGLVDLVIFPVFFRRRENPHRNGRCVFFVARPRPKEVTKISGFFGISQFHSPLTYKEREIFYMFSGWWFQIFSIFIPIWGNDPI